MLDDKKKGSYSRAMNKLDRNDRAHILQLLCEGSSIRAITRVTGASKNTVIKLLIDAGTACSEYQDRVFQNLKCKRVQVDEIWTFTHCKEARVARAKKAPAGAGDTWTWVATCADTKLVPSWLVGERNIEHALVFLADLKDRLDNRVQLTTDGLQIYLGAVEEIFGDDVDYAMLVKVYGHPTEGQTTRYSPPPYIGARKIRIKGKPAREHVITSYSERNNLNMRMHMRRFTRLTNAFSKKVENHAHMVALHFMYSNFVRIHQTLRVSPAMAAGVTNRLWEMSDVVNVLEAWEAKDARATEPPEMPQSN
jgi:IS1 family transposase